MVRYHITVTGLVQGVGFRYFVYHSASKSGLTGWIRNCYDDSVELEVQGEIKSLDKFITELRRGNGFSEVENIISAVIDIKENEKSFRITY
ncbi:MAG: acylphosphatase [Bacillota bacterium]|nr:acylphosphatase [Bacillota bacterium]